MLASDQGRGSRSAGAVDDTGDGGRPRSGGSIGAAVGSLSSGKPVVSAYAAASGGPSGRGIRFPSSRRYLWDRTPAGAQVLVSTQDLLPAVSISASALASVAGAAAGGQSARVPLRLSFAATGTYQLTGLLQSIDPLAAAGDTSSTRQQGAAEAQFSCVLLDRSLSDDGEVFERVGGGNEALVAALCAGLDEHGSARIAEVWVWR